jgi:conserved oligomeric Golgi complex subunit 6
LIDLEIQNEFLSRFESVADAIGSVQKVLDDLNGDCNRLMERVSVAKKNSSELIAETNHLKEEREGVVEKQEVVRMFLDRFELTPDEEKALDSQKVTEAFFLALDKTTAIREDCKTLLQSFGQQTGIDIMDYMAQRIENGFEVLCRWATAQVRDMHEASPDVSPLLVRALVTLLQRPAFYKHFIQELAACRRVALVNRFRDALTIGGPDGVPRPIELHADDPVRYVSDMLAWIHQALASEREFIIALLASDSSDVQRKPPRVQGSDNNRTSPAVLEHLDAVFDGAVRPLSARAQLCYADDETDFVTCYRIENVVGFYQETMGAMVKEDSVLTKCLLEYVFAFKYCI